MVDRPPAALVGRDESLGVLKTAVRRASAGHPSVLLVSGETGVGKTRLLRELVQTQKLTLLYGACVQMAGDPLPFAPLTQALRRLDAAGTLNLQLERSPDLARLVPGLAPTVTRTADLDAASQLGLFQSVLGLLDRLGAVAPVVHVVEDVHWADRSTLDLVRFLATNLATERAVLVVTYRADAVLPGSPLATWLAELGRLALTERVRLDRLDPNATTQLIRHLAGENASPELVESALKRSAGNPLFAEQLVLHAQEDPALLPHTLHELLHARVHVLPAETQDVLRSAAVLGHAVPLTLLAATMGESLDDTETRVRAALAHHVLEIRRDDSIGFRHPAFGEVVYGELLPGERRRLHRAAAEALEPPEGVGIGQLSSVSADAVSGELARHWLGAGDIPRALDASVAAGWAAERMYAFADAHANFTRALGLMEQVSGAAHNRVRLLKHAGQAASLIGDGAEAARLVEAALAITTEPRARAALSTRLGTIYYLAGRGDLSEARFREALSLLPADEESVLLARVYAGLALYGAAWSHYDAAKQAAEHGLLIATSTGARREEALLRNAMGLVIAAQGDLSGGIDHLRHSLSIATETGNPNELAIAYINLSHVLGLAGRVDELVELEREGSATLNKVGLGRQSGSFLKSNTGETLLSAGRVDEADRVIGEAISRLPKGIMAAPVLIQAARIAMIHGDLDLCWERLEEARLIIEEENAPTSWRRTLLEYEVERELWAGRAMPAYEMVLDGLRLVEDTEEQVAAGHLVGLGFQALATEAEAHRDEASRRRIAALRHPLEAALSWSQGDPLHDMAVTCWQHAEMTRLDLESDPVSWAETAALWQAMHRPLPAAYARWREAEARFDSGVDAAGIDALRDAHGAALAMGAVKLVEECERLAGWHRVDLVPAAPAEVEAGAIDKYNLTTRELEVLERLSAGRTNQEIADELFISVKTASVHVSNILRKLDVGGRQEAARVAHRLGVGV